MAVEAVQAIRRMRGGAQSHLMLGSDGNVWVVKFRNNPQGERVLANELIGTRLAAAVGLSVPPVDVVSVSSWLIEHSHEMWVDAGRNERVPCSAGRALGSQFVGGLMPGQVVDYLPEERLSDVRNLGEFAGMLCIDKWTGNSNGRQAVFTRKPKERKYRAVFIDQGYCFQANEWQFSDSPLRGVYAGNKVYEQVTGWQDFEPWLTRIEEMLPETLWTSADDVPTEWYGGNPEELERLVETMLKRRSRVRELITDFRESARAPFPHWGMKRKDLMARSFPLSGDRSKFVM